MIVYPHINKTQLFDLQNDPHEIRDLAGDSAHAKQIERLTGKLKDWQRELGDTQPLRSQKPLPPEFDFSKVPPEEKKKKEKEKASNTSRCSDPHCKFQPLSVTQPVDNVIMSVSKSILPPSVSYAMHPPRCFCS
jgi:hypothetical protein